MAMDPMTRARTLHEAIEHLTVEFATLKASPARRRALRLLRNGYMAFRGSWLGTVLPALKGSTMPDAEKLRVIDEWGDLYQQWAAKLEEYQP